MSNLDLNKKFYNESHAQYGDSKKTLNWGSNYSQIKRFEELTQPFDLHDKTILDVGCGFADLHSWLNEQQISHTYTGIDISDKILSVARSTYPFLTFYQTPVTSLPRDQLFDYVFASGLFTYSIESPYTFLLETVHSMSQLARCGFAFNTLTSSERSPVEGEFHANLPKLISLLSDTDYCQNLQISDSYMPGDATFYVYK